MKRVVLALLLTLVLIAPGWDREIDWFIVFQPWKGAEYERQIAEQQAHIIELEAHLELVETVENLQGAQVQLSASIGATQQQLSAAQAHLAQTLQRVQSIETAEGTVTTWRFNSDSMVPFITTKDLVFLEWFGPYNVGDVVGSYDTSCAFTHRIVEDLGDSWQLVGDAYGGEGCIAQKSLISYKVAAVVKNIF